MHYAVSDPCFEGDPVNIVRYFISRQEAVSSCIAKLHFERRGGGLEQLASRFLGSNAQRPEVQRLTAQYQNIDLSDAAAVRSGLRSVPADVAALCDGNCRAQVAAELGRR